MTEIHAGAYCYSNLGYTNLALDNAQTIREWVVTIAEQMAVTIINGPTVVSFKDYGLPDAGLSVFAIIAESHICCHTWPESNFIRIDIVSCKSFDISKIRGITERLFNIKAWEEQSL